MTSVRFDLDTAAVESLGFDADVEDMLLDAGEAVADTARGLAPERTGAGGASIHPELETDDESAYVDVSWDAEHFYMGFAELGTEHQAPTPFLRPALDSTTV